MIDLLDEITEIPFDVFWEKYMEKKTGHYKMEKAKKEWFYMNESQRIKAFKCLNWDHLFEKPWEYLNYFRSEF